MAGMSVARCSVFYGNDSSPVPQTTKWPTALCLHLSAQRRLLTALLRGEEIFSFASTSSEAFYSRSCNATKPVYRCLLQQRDASRLMEVI